MNVIFDIDGTLVDIRQLWEQAYQTLYQEWFNLTLSTAEIKSLFGVAELSGHSRLLEQHNIYTPQRAHTLVDAVEETMLGVLLKQDLTTKILPGVLDSLEFFKEKNVGLACSTGNIGTIAQRILQQAKLDSYFPVVSCSSLDVQDKAPIVYQALLGLKERGYTAPAAETLVIGDSPSDTKAAKQLGCIAIAVATGHYSSQELAREEPDYLLPNLTTLPSIFNERFK